MNTLWTKGLKKGTQEYKEVEEAYRVSSFLRNRMVVMLQSMLEEELNAMVTDASYDAPNWAYRQADAVGYARAVTRLKKALVDAGKKDL